jgi:hypothetical protein
MRTDRSRLDLPVWWLAPLLAAVIAGCLSETTPDPHEYPDTDPPSETEPHTFYVRPNGDDTQSGLHKHESWRTLTRVNREDLEPGDTVLFEGGKSFEGTLQFVAADSGEASEPVHVSSFGNGRAVIHGGGGDGILITDANHLVIEQLIVSGDWNAEAQSGNDGEGVSVIGSVSGTRRQGLQLRNLEVRGFKNAGIGIHARPEDDTKDSGYANVEIHDCEVHDNGDFGVLSDGPYIYDGPGYSHADVHVRGVSAHHNRGLKNKGEHTGSGIVLSDVEGAVIEHSIAHHNGEFNDHDGGGGFGIWAWDSDRVTIQFSESHDNKTGTSDGGGFDLDGGVTRSVMQFNYSHGNQGAGFGAFQFAYARPYSDNLIQYNISQNDGFSFLVWDGYGDMGALAFAHNVGYGDKPVLATFSALADVAFVNNVFYGTGPQLFDVFDGTALLFQGNDYWTADAPFSIAWNTGTAEPAMFSSFEAYRLATELETLDDDVTGLNVDPELVAAGSGGTLDDTSLLKTLTMYQLRESSPLIDRGVDLQRLGIEAAERDFFDDAVPAGTARDIGVHEAR